MSYQTRTLITLCKEDGFEVDDTDKTNIRVYQHDLELSLQHPYALHLQVYRYTKDPIHRLNAMRQVNRWLWPDSEKTWNSWQERMMLAHCEGHKELVFAGGSSIGKSATAAKIALIFWLSNPHGNACIVASTTLDSLETRIWGYIAKYCSSTAFQTEAVLYRGKPPKILAPGQADKVHGIFAIPVTRGDEDKVLATIIGRHPNNNLLMILDEATDMNPVILSATINLEQGVDSFQLISIGNSKSKSDLHGSMATPKKGWKHIDPTKDFVWETERGGRCLYFYPYDSPAITDPDPVKRVLLSKFLINKETLAEKVKKYGYESEIYRRFVLGFWPGSGASDAIFITEEFAIEQGVTKPTEWAGLGTMEWLASLDFAMAVGSRGCILRRALFGQDVSGLYVIDYGGVEFIDYIDIQASSIKSSELQIAETVAEKLFQYNIPISRLTIDASGIGRALGGLIKVVAGSDVEPVKVVSTYKVTQILGEDMRLRNAGKAVKDPSIYLTSPLQLWAGFREAIQQRCIRNLDPDSFRQLTTRKYEQSPKGMTLETKAEYISRMNAIDPKGKHSPDEIDTAILIAKGAAILLDWTPGSVNQVMFTNEAERRVAEKMYQQNIHQASMRPEYPKLGTPFSSNLESLAGTNYRGSR